MWAQFCADIGKVNGGNFALVEYKERERRLKFQLTRAQFSALRDRRQTNIAVVIAEESDHRTELPYATLLKISSTSKP